MLEKPTLEANKGKLNFDISLTNCKDILEIIIGLFTLATSF